MKRETKICLSLGCVYPIKPPGFGVSAQACWPWTWVAAAMGSDEVKCEGNVWGSLTVLESGLWSYLERIRAVTHPTPLTPTGNERERGQPVSPELIVMRIGWWPTDCKLFLCVFDWKGVDGCAVDGCSSARYGTVPSLEDMLTVRFHVLSLLSDTFLALIHVVLWRRNRICCWNCMEDVQALHVRVTEYSTSTETFSITVEPDTYLHRVEIIWIAIIILIITEDTLD